MKSKLITAGTALAVGAAAIAVPALAATKNVKVGDNYFVRASGVPVVKAKVGDTVKWTWTGDKPHNVKVSKGPVKFASRVKESGTYSKKLSKAGTYTIICVVHGAKDQSMKLVVAKK